jgi:hypothetical protein
MKRGMELHLFSSEHSHVPRRSRAGRAKHLARVAAEYVQLLYHADKAREENCAFIEGAQWVYRLP